MMDLHSGYPFSLVKNGLPFDYPKLNNNIRTDVAIIGGGISGALAAYHLINSGIDCVVLERRTIGFGSTCGSTSLLQYELDVSVQRLIKLAGERNAIRIYKLCYETIDKLAAIARKLRLKEFQRKSSLQYAAEVEHQKELFEEFTIRKRNGFNVKWLTGAELKTEYQFSAPCAILTLDGAETDAYLFTHALFQHGIRNGLKVYDRTNVVGFDHGKRKVIMLTDNKLKITAKKVLYAVGYEAGEYVDTKLLKLHSTYVTVSESLATDKAIWKDDVMIWSTGNPYLYMRTTPDRRIMIGGRDSPFSSPAKRDKLINMKSTTLIRDFSKLFPEIQFIPEFRWTGTFGITDDALPCIGTYRSLPNSYFALGFAGNGILFSQIAAEMITDLLLGKKSPDIELFAFDRIKKDNR